MTKHFIFTGTFVLCWAFSSDCLTNKALDTCTLDIINFQAVILSKTVTHENHL